MSSVGKGYQSSNISEFESEMWLFMNKEELHNFIEKQQPIL